MVSTRSAWVAVFWLIFTAAFYLYLPHFVPFCCHLDEKTCDIICRQICLGCFYGDSRRSASFLIFFFPVSFSALPSRNVWPLRLSHISENRRDRQKFRINARSTSFGPSALFNSEINHPALTWSRHVREGAQPPSSAVVRLPGQHVWSLRWDDGAGALR